MKLEYYGMIFILIGVMFAGKSITTGMSDQPTITKCGTVVRKYDDHDLNDGKHPYIEHNYYMDMNFNGRYETRDVQTNTYYTFKVGDRVCFTDYDRSKMGGRSAWIVFGGAAALFFIFYGLYKLIGERSDRNNSW